jgi:UDP-glucose 4-epimerase
MSTTKSILLTGSTGYIGSIFKEKLLLSGHRVIEAGRHKTSMVHLDLSCPLPVIDLNSYHGSIDACVHLAASNEVSCTQDPSRAFIQSVNGTKALLDSCIKNGIPMFVYISTFHVFGHNCGALTETCVPQPNNDYGLYHTLAEAILVKEAQLGRIRILIIRPSNIVGVPANWSSFNRWSLAPFDFCRQAYFHKNITLRSTGTQIRNWVGSLDVYAVLRDQLSSHSYSLLHVSGADLSVFQFAHSIAAEWQNLFGETISIRCAISPHHQLEPSRSFLSQHIASHPFPCLTAFVRAAYEYLQQN